MSKSAFSKILQVGIIVKDIEKSMKTYEEVYGIGPWELYECDSSWIKNMHIRGKKEDFAMRLALCQVGEVQLELIEPKDDKSDYARFLKEHGEGMHHLAIDEDKENYRTLMQERNNEEIMGGVLLTKCSYFDTKEDLGFITEIYEPKDNE